MEILRAIFKLTIAFSTAACIIAFTKISFPVVGFFMFLFFSFYEFSKALLVRGKKFTYGEALRRADTMSSPVSIKSTKTEENRILRCACSSMQGWRRSMEDAHTLIVRPDLALFGIYDGHGGAETSNFCAEHLPEFILQSEAFTQGDIAKALIDGFVNLDKHLYFLNKRNRSGSTAVVLFVYRDVLYCANAGDSRCVICRKGTALPLSCDHKPFLPGELCRIEKAGSYVINRRVNGVLALSRAIGDFGFKSNGSLPWEQQAVISTPEVISTPLNRSEDTFAVIACDGVWDVLTNEEVIDFVKMRLDEKKSASSIAEELMDRCLSTQPFGIGCDNMSVIIAVFKQAEETTQHSEIDF